MFQASPYAMLSQTLAAGPYCHAHHTQLQCSANTGAASARINSQAKGRPNKGILAARYSLESPDSFLDYTTSFLLTIRPSCNTQQQGTVVTFSRKHRV